MTAPTDSAQPVCGRVEKLFRMERHGTAMVELQHGDVLACTTGLGIEGDVHAHRLSPRQILVTLQSELDELKIAPGALRENLVISSNIAELFRPGTALVTDKGVEIDLTMYCEPCKRILPVVGDLGSMINRRGVLGYIRNGGPIALHDTITLRAHHHAALPESPYQKFLDFVPTIPAGKVVRYLDVTIAMGVADSFVRALPGYIKRSTGLNIPLHRIVNAHGALLNYVPDQAELLLREGLAIEVRREGLGSPLGSVELDRHLWRG